MVRHPQLSRLLPIHLPKIRCLLIFSARLPHRPHDHYRSLPQDHSQIIDTESSQYRVSSLHCGHLADSSHNTHSPACTNTRILPECLSLHGSGRQLKLSAAGLLWNAKLRALKINSSIYSWNCLRRVGTHNYSHHHHCHFWN